MAGGHCVSGSARKRRGRARGSARADCFEAIVSAEDVHRGKPDPEVFLIAATKLGVVAERCVVVEDAAHGIEAARAARMKSIGVSRDGKQLNADLVVRSLDRLVPTAFDSLMGDH